ncbi:AAA family ATPase [Viridibacillus sp. YIM B01967]|uniref:AAA family ATPase n=1 Tax=Viridibacillus soli TaxID=2798301 RepID=A0ABS1HCV2_9BACL|nr:AAA family ATPase [Viridibacillus soli]MBK3497248.1 AAA family ATPase [Viridibacillus soli]
MFFIQMSGFPGSGKSTLAQAISKRTGAIIIDHDIIKSALLMSSTETLDRKTSGSISYAIDWQLIDYYLGLDNSVILDSPCLYDELIERGLSLQKKHNVIYKYVECYLNDFEEINHRLASRNRMLSQIASVNSKEDFLYTIQNSKKPEQINCLKVDTSQPLESYIDRVMDYIQNDHCFS